MPCCDGFVLKQITTPWFSSFLQQQLDGLECVLNLTSSVLGGPKAPPCHPSKHVQTLVVSVGKRMPIILIRERVHDRSGVVELRITKHRSVMLVQYLSICGKTARLFLSW